jgi:pimeloyl-ACP methyl ester carboxylesterase
MRYIYPMALALLFNSCGSDTTTTTEQSVTNYSNEVPCQNFFTTNSYEPYTCGYMNAIENRDTFGGKSIKIAYVKINSKNEESTEAPVVYFEGGPGGGAIENINRWINSPILDEHDIILMDQRGTGFSSPRLTCPSSSNLNISGEREQRKARLLECRDSIAASGFVSSQYNTTNIAKDAEALRGHLGITQWFVYGISYGTAVAQEYMRQYPSATKAVIIDGVTSLTSGWYSETISDHAKAFNNIFAQCSRTRECGVAYPDLKRRFLETIKRYNDTPASFTSEGVTYTYSGRDIDYALFSLMYSTELIPAVPKLIDDLYSDRREEFESLISRVYSGLSTFADGMHYSVVCHDFGNLELLGTALSNHVAYPEYQALGLLETSYGTIDACKEWDIDKADPTFNQNVVSDIPTLLLSGELDPIAPPANADSAKTNLSNSRHYVVTAAGHGASLEPCGQEILLNFLNNQGREPDNSCLVDVAGVKFLTSKKTHSSNDESLVDKLERYSLLHR